MNAPDPGGGYRLLKKKPEPEETIQGDEYFNGVDWHLGTSWKYCNGKQDVDYFYRRKLKEPIGPSPESPWDFRDPSTTDSDRLEAIVYKLNGIETLLARLCDLIELRNL